MGKQKQIKSKQIEKTQKPIQKQKLIQKQKIVKPKPKSEPAKKSKTISLQDLVKKNPNFTLIQNGKLKCKLTGHEMPATIQQFQNYQNTKSYKRGLQTQYDISEYEQIIVQHKQDPKFLYCQLTGVKIPKKKSAIQKHVKGKKFQKRLQEYKQEAGEQMDESQIEEESEQDKQEN